jgi:hypothetical protein
LGPVFKTGIMVRIPFFEANSGISVYDKTLFDEFPKPSNKTMKEFTTSFFGKSAIYIFDVLSSALKNIVSILCPNEMVEIKSVSKSNFIFFNVKFLCLLVTVCRFAKACIFSTKLH